VSVLSLPTPAAPAAAPAFAHGARRLAAPGRPVDRATLAHHIAIVPIPARTLILVTGNGPGELPADGALARWISARLRSICARLVAGDASSLHFRQEALGLAALGPDPAPAGEEMLIGLGATARRLAAGRLLPEPAVAAFLASLGGIGGADMPKPILRALDDAARGGFPAPVAALAEILGDRDAEDGALKEATLRLTAGGTRPGADALAGMVALVRDVALGPL
jgi:hypothetical protein